MPAEPDSVWVRPPRGRRGEPPTLSREQIVRAAIELLDAEGLAGLSMRRLGSKLGSGATSIYWYVANKNDLLDLAVDEVMAEVYVPEPGDTSWRIAASIMTTGMRTMLLRHPWVTGLYGVRANIGPNSVRASERMVGVMTSAGFTGMDLAHASTLLMSHAMGSAVAVSGANATARATGIPVKDLFKELEPHWDKLTADSPSYRKWWETAHTPDFDPVQMWDESFTFGLERLLDGLELWLNQQPGGSA